MSNSEGPRPARSRSDALGQQQKYRDGDGIGAVETPVQARGGFRGPAMLWVLGISLLLAIIAYAILQGWFGAAPHPTR